MEQWRRVRAADSMPDAGLVDLSGALSGLVAADQGASLSGTHPQHPRNIMIIKDPLCPPQIPEKYKSIQWADRQRVLYIYIFLYVLMVKWRNSGQCGTNITLPRCQSDIPQQPEFMFMFNADQHQRGTVVCRKKKVIQWHARNIKTGRAIRHSAPLVGDFNVPISNKCEARSSTPLWIRDPVKRIELLHPRERAYINKCKSKKKRETRDNTFFFLKSAPSVILSFDTFGRHHRIIQLTFAA